VCLVKSNTETSSFTALIPLKLSHMMERSQVLTKASMKMAVFRDAAPCSLVETDGRFASTYSLHHQGGTASQETARRKSDDVHTSDSPQKKRQQLTWRDFIALTWHFTLISEIFLSQRASVKSRPIFYVFCLHFKYIYLATTKSWLLEIHASQTPITGHWILRHN
jgi:hypothetical protein